MTAVLPADEGAAVEVALGLATHDELFHFLRPGFRLSEGSEADRVSWAGALVAMADRSLCPGPLLPAPSATATRCCSTSISGPTGRLGSHLHLGPGVGEGISRLILPLRQPGADGDRGERKAPQRGPDLPQCARAHPHRSGGPGRRVPGAGL